MYRFSKPSWLPHARRTAETAATENPEGHCWKSGLSKRGRVARTYRGTLACVHDLLDQRRGSSDETESCAWSDYFGETVHSDDSAVNVEG